MGLSGVMTTLGGESGQTAFGLGTAVGLVAASDVFGSGAAANGAECVYSDMGLGAEYSIVDCRSVGMNDLGTECGGAVRALNFGKRLVQHLCHGDCWVWLGRCVGWDECCGGAAAEA